jgi:hypothetical protein
MCKLLKKCILLVFCIGCVFGLIACDSEPSGSWGSGLSVIEKPSSENSSTGGSSSKEENSGGENPLLNPPTSSGVWTPPTTMD